LQLPSGRAQGVWQTDCDRPDWEIEPDRLAREASRPSRAQWIDYFLFSKGLTTKQMPEFGIGRAGN